MKTITIRLSAVEAAMLAEVQKWNKGYKDLSKFLNDQIRKEYASLTGNR